MGNGWHEWPLVIFTVLGQCVVGALIVSGIGWFAAKNDADRQHIVRGMFFLWLLMGIGFIASVMHLGSPLRAFNSLNRIGASGLSNEIAAGSIFFAVGGLWWLVAVIGKMPQALGKLWLLVSMALGVIFVWMMTCVYQIDTVPTWYNGYTTLAFFLTVLLSGPILAATILRAARVTFNTTPFAIISGSGADRLCRGDCAARFVSGVYSLIRTTSQRAGTRLRLLTGLACGIVMRRSRMLALSAHSSP